MRKDVSVGVGLCPYRTSRSTTSEEGDDNAELDIVVAVAVAAAAAVAVVAAAVAVTAQFAML